MESVDLESWELIKQRVIFNTSLRIGSNGIKLQ